MLEGQGWVGNTSKSHGNLSLGSGAGEFLLPGARGGRGGEQGEPGAAGPASLTLAAGSVVAWGAPVAVRSLEVGFAHARPHPRVLATGVAFGPTGVAVAVWSGDTQTSKATRGCQMISAAGQRSRKKTGKELPREVTAQAFASSQPS